MIVRIATEGQYELPQGDEGTLNELDNAAVAAIDAGDDERFRAAFRKLVEFVRAHGRKVAGDTLAPSDMILPPPDVSIDEAREAFKGEGLIPG